MGLGLLKQAGVIITSRYSAIPLKHVPVLSQNTEAYKYIS